MSIGKTALFGGIGLAGVSLFGMSRLADSTKSDRSTAHQLNKGDIGGLKALENVYGGSIFSDAKSMLGEVKGVMRGEGGYSEMIKLGNLIGKSVDELSAMKPVDVLTDATIASKEFADNLRATGNGFFVNNPAMTSGQLPSMFAEKLQDIDSYALSELRAKRGQVGDYQSRLELGDKDAKDWENFSIAKDNMFDVATQRFKEKIVSLTAPLTELGGSVENVVMALLGSELMGDAVKFTTDKLTEFSKYVASDQAKKDWDELRKDAKEAGAMLHDFGVGMRKWGVRLGFFEETQAEKNLRELQESMPEDPFSKSDGTLQGDYKENFENDVGVNAVKGAYNYIADKFSSAFNGGSKDINDKSLTFDDAPVVMAEFMKLGLKQHEAAGITAQMWEESNFRTKATGDKIINGKVSNSYQQAEGGFQWREGRKTKFREIIGKEIADSNRAEQIRFAYWELNNTEKNAGDMIRATKTARQAGRAGVEYERPKDRAGAEAARAAIAERFDNMYQGYTQKKEDNAPISSRLFGGGTPILKKLAEAQAAKDGYVPLKNYAPSPKNTQQIPLSKTPSMPYLTLNINNQTGSNVNTEALKY